MDSLLHNSRKPDVSFFRSGRIDITASVCKALDLHVGDVIDVAVDGSEYYLFVRHRHDPSSPSIGRHQATVRSTKGKSHNMRCYSSKLCQLMLSLFTDTDHDVLRVPAGKVKTNSCYGNMVSLVTSIKIQ